jgi:hypothetical protein
MEPAMKSERYPYKVAAVYQDGAAAETAARALENADLGDIEIIRLVPDQGDIDLSVEPGPEASRDTLIRDTAAGTAAGAAAAGSTATVAAPTLFVSAPIVGPLILLGYGAMIGGTVGAIRGLKLRESMLAGVVKDALKAGYPVVVINAADEDAKRRVQDVVDDSMAKQAAHN